MVHWFVELHPTEKFPSHTLPFRFFGQHGLIRRLSQFGTDTVGEVRWFRVTHNGMMLLQDGSQRLALRKLTNLRGQER